MGSPERTTSTTRLRSAAASSARRLHADSSAGWPSSAREKPRQRRSANSPRNRSPAVRGAGRPAPRDRADSAASASPGTSSASGVAAGTSASACASRSVSALGYGSGFTRTSGRYGPASIRQSSRRARNGIPGGKPAKKPRSKRSSRAAKWSRGFPRRQTPAWRKIEAQMTGTSVSARWGATSMDPSRRRKPGGNSVRERKAARV